MVKNLVYLLCATFLCLTMSCSQSESSPRPRSNPQLGCGPYPDQPSSLYVLPYEVGSAFVVGQGNCAPNGRSHATGSLDQYSYDILMPIGTNMVAARGGEVTLVVEHFEENNGVPGQENEINIKHADGTFGVYFHLTKDGGLVSVGDVVRQGQVIGLSGNTGSSSEPHLHFHVWSVPLATTIATVFKNTIEHPEGLVEGVRYTAESY